MRAALFCNFSNFRLRPLPLSSSIHLVKMDDSRTLLSSLVGSGWVLCYYLLVRTPPVLTLAGRSGKYGGLWLMSNLATYVTSEVLILF